MGAGGCIFRYGCAICPYATIGAIGIITTVVTVVSNGYKIRIMLIWVVVIPKYVWRRGPCGQLSGWRSGMGVGAVTRGGP